MKIKSTKNVRPDAGVAMISTLLVLLGITSLIVVGMVRSSNRQASGSLSEETGNQFEQTARRGYQYQAQSLSETGIRLSLQWLVNQTTTPTNTTSFAPSSVSNFYGGTTATNRWSKLTLAMSPTSTQLSGVPAQSGEIYVKFYPYTSNASGGRKMFAIESEGRIQGRSYLSRVFVRQNTFARFAYFSDVCPTSWWVTQLTRFQGPVHINGLNTAGTAVDTAARMNMIWRNNISSTSARLFTYTDPDYFTTAMTSSQLLFFRTDGNTTWSEIPTTTTNWGFVTTREMRPLERVRFLVLP
jgi:hypothetical protein